MTEAPAGSEQVTLFQFEDCELDLTLYELRRAGAPVHMEPQVFDVLSYLVKNHVRVVTKDELINHIWPDAYISEAALNSRLMAARKAVGDNGREQRLIKTIYGRGFRFIAPVIEGAPAPATAPPTADTTPPRAAAPAVDDEPAAAVPITRGVPGLEEPATSFIGRHDELARLEQVLATPQNRLVTIVGPGGVGKTRLAIELLRREQARGLDVAFVGLESLDEPDDLPLRVAASLGRTIVTGNVADELLEHLRHRRMLVVLDNFEHLAEEGAEFVSRITDAAPDIQLVITSRIVLGLKQEWLFPIGGLRVQYDDATADPEALRLFIERSRQANALSGLDQDDAQEAIAEVCRLVDGMPLAIELAASLTRYLSPRDIAAQIARDLDVLRSDLRNVPVRHRSVPGLLEESFRHLTVEQMRALLSLSVFEGSFRAESAQAVADAPFGTLMELVDQSLVQPREGRFALHPLMRQFARERLGQAFEDLRQRHAEHFASFAADRLQALEAVRQVEATFELEREFVNLSAAWRWAASTGHFELIGRLSRPLFLYIQYRSRLTEGNELARLALEAMDRHGAGETLACAELLVNFAWIELRMGPYESAVKALVRAQGIYKALEELPPRGMAGDPTTAFAVIQIGAGDYQQAYDLASTAIETAEQRGDDLARAFALFVAGVSKFRTVQIEYKPESGAYAWAEGEVGHGRAAEASELVDQAVELLETHGERWLRGQVEIERGVHCASRGRLPAAFEHYELAYQLRSEFQDPHGMGDAILRMADTCIDNGDLDRAEGLHKECYRLHRDLGDISALSEVHRSMGVLEQRRNNYAAAWPQLKKALELALSIGYSNNTVSSLRAMGEILFDMGNDEDALPLLAFVVDHQASTPFTRGRAKSALDRVATRLGPETIEAARELGRQTPIDQFAADVMKRLDGIFPNVSDEELAPL